nr:hypothetical protein CFP56_41042 [Quercus suber]
MAIRLDQGWVVHWVMDSQWFDLFSGGYPENEGWIGRGRGQGMGRRRTISLLGLRDGSSFFGCEFGEDVLQVE